MDLECASASKAVVAPCVGADPAGIGEADLWARCRHGDSRAREQLLDLHLPYARVVATTHHARDATDEIDFGDYLQLATVGLIECVDRYDPSFEVEFRTFAARRVGGSIIDGIERMSEIRQQAAAHKRYEKIREDGEGGEPLVAYILGAGLGFALAWLMEGTGMLAQDALAALPRQCSVELRQLREAIDELVKALPDQERGVIYGHYFQDRPFLEIAATKGLTKGRISQVHQKALIRLRESLCDAGHGGLAS
jgi:RNA polymerase sigma factor for flagellar operon FliA